MSKWIVWSKPAPLRVLAVAAVLAVVVAVPVALILDRLGGRPLVVRISAVLVGVLVGRIYVDSRKPKGEQS